MAAEQDGGKGVEVFRAALLAWYDRHRRVFPWRALTGERPDPYRVWLSEIMLQQTTVTAVISYFQKFTETWPTIEALAVAPEEEIMNAWAGLGYYSRARNLHKCAKTVVECYGGVFPDQQEALESAWYRRVHICRDCRDRFQQTGHSH